MFDLWKDSSGVGLATTLQLQAYEIYQNMRRVQREKHGLFYKYNDYYTLDGQLVAVCVGEYKEYYDKNVEGWIQILKERGKEVSKMLKKQMEQLELEVKKAKEGII